MANKAKIGYWIKTIDGNIVFLSDSTGWDVLLDSAILRFHKDSAQECITSTFALCNVIEWYYGEKRMRDS